MLHVITLCNMIDLVPPPLPPLPPLLPLLQGLHHCLPMVQSMGYAGAGSLLAACTVPMQPAAVTVSATAMLFQRLHAHGSAELLYIVGASMTDRLYHC